MMSEKTIKRVVVILIKPSSYDDDGFVYRFARGVLPSNSLAVMNTLTEQALADVAPSGVPTEVHLLEDGIRGHVRTLRRLASRFPEDGTKLIVGLVAVQTAQFPRACDLMHSWQQRGAVCVIGGFHVSGSISTMYHGVVDSKRSTIPCPHEMPTEVASLMDRGVVVFHGEAEQVWRDALADILSGTPQQLYSGGRPGLSNAPVPAYPNDYFRRSFAVPIGTFDTGRGCPFTCSFCTIINVQGRESRFRDPSAIVATVKDYCERDGRAHFFFTDDNFARNPQWEEILDGLIGLREEGYRIAFLVEADLACGNIRGFIPKLAQAGCTQIFMGVESMNPANLREAHKFQNQVAHYKQLWDTCHEHGINIHAGYIVGFSHDTPDSVAEDVTRLQEAGADLVSFFMLTPLPGSEDHIRMYMDGVEMDPDFNRYDSFRPVIAHPRMSRQEWLDTFWRAWRQFYRVEHMIAVLKRCQTTRQRRGLLSNYIWYRWSVLTEQTHPMIAGFYRIRPWAERRPGACRLSYWRYLLNEAWRNVRYAGRFLAEFYVFQHVVFETECRPVLAERREAVSDRLHGLGDWIRRTFGPQMSRRWLNQFWINYARNRWRLLFDPRRWTWHVSAIPRAVTEVVYTIRWVLLFRRIMFE